MSAITFVLIGSLGTLGHWRLAYDAATLVNQAISDGQVSIITEKWDMPKHMKVPFSEVSFINPRPQLPSRGGHLISDYSGDDLVRTFRHHEGSVFIFSTFFTKDLTRLARRYGKRCVWMTYPLRDSYWELFKLDGYQSLFDESVILEDVYWSELLIQASQTQTTTLPATAYALTNRWKEFRKPFPSKILIMSGGGGLPGTSMFVETVLSVIENNSLDSLRNIQLVVLPGPFASKLEYKQKKTHMDAISLKELLGPNTLVISQAGYHTVHELIASNTPSILIPGERSIDNQELRAVSLAKQVGVPLYLPQEIESFSDNLTEILADNMRPKQILESMMELKVKREWTFPAAYYLWFEKLRYWCTF